MDPTSKSKCADRRVHVLWGFFIFFIFGTEPVFTVLQERNLHSGQRPGDLHRQGDGSEAATQRNQRRREARATPNDPHDPLILDLTPPPHPPRGFPFAIVLPSVPVGDDEGAR